MPDAHIASSLLETLEVEQDPFWSWHWTLQSAGFKNPTPLLGATRLTDLAINVVLPWLWIRAVEGKSEKVRQQIEHRYFAWPAAQDNSVLRLARPPGCCPEQPLSRDYSNSCAIFATIPIQYAMPANCRRWLQNSRAAK